VGCRTSEHCNRYCDRQHCSRWVPGGVGGWYGSPIQQAFLEKARRRGYGCSVPMVSLRSWASPPMFSNVRVCFETQHPLGVRALRARLAKAKRLCSRLKRGVERPLLGKSVLHTRAAVPARQRLSQFDPELRVGVPNSGRWRRWKRTLSGSRHQRKLRSSR